jgi:hypothetical protein
MFGSTLALDREIALNSSCCLMVGELSCGGKRSKKIAGFSGLLAGRTKEAATIDEINEAAAKGWADEKTRTRAKL